MLTGQKASTRADGRGGGTHPCLPGSVLGTFVHMSSFKPHLGSRWVGVGDVGAYCIALSAEHCWGD